MRLLRICVLSLSASAAFAIEQPPMTGQPPIDMLPESRPPLTMPGETRLVSFVYDPNETYTILCMPNAVTHIELHKEEQVVALAIGDGAQWQAQKKNNHLFLRPLRPGLFTSATLVTNQRTYQLTLRASPHGGKWYQRVSWQYPDLIIMEENQAAVDLARARLAEKAEPQVERPAPLRTVPVDKLNFAYEISGDAPFRPAQVFDDGTFTYIRFKEKPQEMPAPFIKTPDGYAVAIYTLEPDSPTMKINRVFSSAVLKLGSEEVQISAERRQR
jgi:type IV secretion system protein VirB9